jgi:hypothetical protein
MPSGPSASNDLIGQLTGSLVSSVEASKDVKSDTVPAAESQN